MWERFTVPVMLEVTKIEDCTDIGSGKVKVIGFDKSSFSGELRLKATLELVERDRVG